MLRNIVSVSMVCLLLAIAGWKEESDNEQKTPASSYGSEIWSWSRDGESYNQELLSCQYGWCYSACPECPQPITLYVLQFDAFRKLVYLFQRTQEAIDSFNVSNSAMVVLYVITQILLLMLHRAYGSNRESIERVRRSQSLEWLTDEIKEIKQANWRCQLHEEEMELMAQTIEYLQRGKVHVTHAHPLKVLKVTYPPIITCEYPDAQPQLPVQSEVCLTEPISSSASSSEDDLDLLMNFSDPEFIEPEYEWDSEYDFG